MTGASAVVAPGARAPMLCDHARLTRAHYVILTLCWAGWLFDFYDLMLFSFLVVPIRASLGVSDAAMSLLLGTTLGATALGGLIFGWLADRYGRKATLSWSILVYSIGALLSGLAPNAAWLLLARIVTGLGVGGEWATGQAMIAETFPARSRGQCAAIVQTGAPFGVALASLVGGLLAPALAHRFGPDWGWRAAFFLSVLPALLVVVIRARMPESDVWLQQEAGPRVRTRGRVAELLGVPALRAAFLKCLVLAMAGMSAYWFTYLWLPTYLYQKLGFSMARSVAWVLVSQAGGLLGHLTLGGLSDRFGRRVTFSMYCVLWAVALSGVTLFWTRVAQQPGLALACMFVVGSGAGIFSGYGPIYSELFPTRLRGTAMGAALNLGRGVQFFTPLVITGIAARYGLGGGIAPAIGFLLIAAAWVWVLPETKGREIRGEA
jgi:MFS family permease